jgi:hypothetical protein
VSFELDEMTPVIHRHSTHIDADVSWL